MIIRGADNNTVDPKFMFSNVPTTFIEPGVDKRWLFNLAAATRISSLLTAIETLDNEQHRKLFRVLLGGILVNISNVAVNGKGRRYRSGWENRRHTPDEVNKMFYMAANRAIVEIHRFRNRPCLTSEVLRGDCREVLNENIQCDVAVFSPPYPNSFDYTDVYNIELWMLGYLANKDDNLTLRNSTLYSHVQVARNFQQVPSISNTLNEILEQLDAVRPQLWNNRIPEMVGGYFVDLSTVLSYIARSLIPGGQVWMVVGDSRYANVHIDTATIISQLAASSGLTINCIEPFRSMRASPQQGGRKELKESLIVLTKL